MKRLAIYIILLTSLLTACITPEPVPSDALTIVSGVSNNTLLFDGAEGSQVTFTIKSKLPWELLDTPGVTYSPSSGEATPEGERTEITATINRANNTLQTVDIGDVIIRLSRTRFTGIVARQNPQVILSQTEFTIDAAKNKYTHIEFECKSLDIDTNSDGNITTIVELATKKHKFLLSVAATRDNLSAEEIVAGHISFRINGTTIEDKVTIYQKPAISVNRSRMTINGVSGSATSFTIDTPFNFTATTSSTAFTATKGSDSTVILTATEPNNGSSERKLGTLTLSPTHNPNCRISVDVWQRKATAKQTMLFYFLGTNLKSYYESNLKMVEQVVEKNNLDDCRIIAFMQSSKNSGSIYEIIYDKGLNCVLREHRGDYNLPTIYNEEMFHQILADMANSAPAEEYGLFIGSHGKGWIPKRVGTSSRAYSTMAAEKDIWTPAPGAALVRHIGDSDNTQLNTTELASAIERLSCKLSYIIFDACYMSNIESAYDLRRCAEYILASPCEVMASGMPYNDIVPIMIGSGDIKSRLESSAKAFVDFYADDNSIYASACSAVINCTELDALAEATKQANSYLQTIDPATIQYYDGISSSANPTHIFFDLEDYIAKSCTDAAAVAEFKKQLDKTVTGRYHTETFYSTYNNKANPITSYCGLTTSAPITLNPASAYIADWKQTEWAKKISY